MFYSGRRTADGAGCGLYHPRPMLATAEAQILLHPCTQRSQPPLAIHTTRLSYRESSAKVRGHLAQHRPTNLLPAYVNADVEGQIAEKIFTPARLSRSKML